jgi:hypothetical protein
MNNYNLKHKQYEMCELEKNISSLSKVKILIHQTLTPEFCVKHFLEAESDSDEDNDISIGDILKCQPHISKEALMDARRFVNGDDI